MSQLPPALPASASLSAPSSDNPVPAACPAPAAYVSALGSLRGVLTLLVVLHHALLAYHPYAPPVGPSLSAMPFWRAFPVVDAQRWSGATWIVGWNDTFFMALMFLLSGLFVWPSLTRKGAAAYARDRLLRLGLPFAVAALALSPLAYIPSYLQTGATWSWSGFWTAWIALDGWPTGPAWFLSVLLVFDVAALALFSLLRLLRPLRPARLNAASASGSLRSSKAANAASPSRPAPLRRALAFLTQRPLAFALVLAALAVVTYVPLAQRYGTMRWSELGPLTFQTSRLGLYAAFFLVGLAAGATGLARSALVAPRGLARLWWILVPLAAAAFYASTRAAITAITAMGLSASANRTAAIAYALACAAISLALLSLFVRLGRALSSSRAAPRTSAMRALQHHAYGIYLFHYAAVSWLQYAALSAPLPGFVKALLVFVLAIAAAFALTSALRRLRLFARVL